MAPPKKNEGLVFYRDFPGSKNARNLGLQILQRKKQFKGAFSRPTAYDFSGKLRGSNNFFPDASMGLGTIWKLHENP